VATVIFFIVFIIQNVRNRPHAHNGEAHE
jgi:hypothetical protein